MSVCSLNVDVSTIVSWFRLPIAVTCCSAHWYCHLLTDFPRILDGQHADFQPITYTRTLVGYCGSIKRRLSVRLGTRHDVKSLLGRMKTPRRARPPIPPLKAYNASGLSFTCTLYTHVVIWGHQHSNINQRKRLFVLAYYQRCMCVHQHTSKLTRAVFSGS